MSHRTKHIFEYGMLRVLLVLGKILPLRAALGLGWLIGRFFFHVLRFRRTKAESRLKQVFGNRFSAQERKRIAWLSFRNICFNAVEAARYSLLTVQKLKRMPLYIGIATMQETYQKNGPFIFATAHMGNWELGGVACKLAGIPVFSIARQQKNPLADDLLNQIRSITGMDVVLNNAAVLKNVVRRLKAGEVLAILPDVRSSTEALAIDFLGEKANLGAGTALFAQMANCPIFMGLLMGMNLCPPFLLSIAYVFTLHSAWRGIVYFMIFFATTTLYFLPLFFLGPLSRISEFRRAGRLSAVGVGILFCAYGIWLFGK